ncbi:hypothetical protein HS1_000204 [Candidatus Desulfofervidus auxilii]|uniref:Uncharacterized protein n=1 Tax=Desulfofervidus auxilii TaxID=1621989 RepID=A0A7U4QIM8_DESA2|nr:hypothetical protein [Candidatus Desulfofervidus auxilii]AMM40010.1 hypothetical protein HS1_000204 [Candidatus Desulfofervidus auxilii]
MKYLIECKPDKLLIKLVTGAPKKSVIHTANKTEVIKMLFKIPDDAIGIIDEDPGSSHPSHLKKFRLKQDLSEHGLAMLEENDSGKKLVIIKPRLEEWLLRAGKESAISFKEYNLPETGKDLHKVINTNLERLKLVLKELLEERCVRLQKLKEILLK